MKHRRTGTGGGKGGKGDGTGLGHRVPGRGHLGGRLFKRRGGRR